MFSKAFRWPMAPCSDQVLLPPHDDADVHGYWEFQLSMVVRLSSIGDTYTVHFTTLNATVQLEPESLLPLGWSVQAAIAHPCVYFTEVGFARFFRRE